MGKVMGKNVRKFLSSRSTKCQKMTPKSTNMTDSLVTTQIGHTDFEELFRTIEFQNFLSHFGILTSVEFSDIFVHQSRISNNREYFKHFLTFSCITFQPT